MDGTPDRRSRQIVAGTSLLLAGVGIAAVGRAAAQRAPYSDGATLFATFAAELFFACCAVGGALLVGRGVLPRGLRLERPRMSAGEITIVAVGFVCMSHGLSLVLSLLALRSRGTLGEIDDLVGGMQGSSRALLFVTLGLAPAIAEELLFRGLIQQSLLRPLGAAGAIGVASLAFGAVHLDAAQSSAAFVLGLYLGTALEAGGSLPVTILCHAINNSLALLGSLSIDGASAVAEAEAAASGLKYALAAASLLSLGVGLLAFVVRRQSEARAADASTTPPGDPALPPLPPP